MKRTGLALLLAASCLSGCIGLDIVYLAVIAAQNTTSDLTPIGETVMPTKLDAAVPAQYQPFVYRKDQDCTFSAIMVPYDRTWPEEIQQEGNVTLLPPEPGKIAGYVAVIYKKECPNKEAGRILRAGIQGTEKKAGLFDSLEDGDTIVMRHGDGGSIGRALDSSDMTVKGKEQPQWWPQVVARMTRLAPTDPAVKGALAFSKELFILSLPDYKEKINAAIEQEAPEKLGSGYSPR